ncbi:MAG TPA: GNAT family protein [Gaiellales bacterium]|nr:GNAT family protein [Gaiellales bacterium]
MILRGRRLVVRSMQEPDVARLAEIAAEPEIWQRWGEVSEADLRAKLAGAADDVTGLVVELDGEVVGLIQYHEETDPDYRHAGVDMFLAEGARGQGYGREALLLVAGHLFEQRGHHRLTIDPAADNEPAIRCYAAAGFRTVGVMRRYERGRDGSFHDGLLMELVRPDQPSG